MIIKNKLFAVTLEGNINYSIVAFDMEEVIELMRKWRPTNRIIGVKEIDIVLTREELEDL